MSSGSSFQLRVSPIIMWVEPVHHCNPQRAIYSRLQSLSNWKCALTAKNSAVNSVMNSIQSDNSRSQPGPIDQLRLRIHKWNKCAISNFSVVLISLFYHKTAYQSLSLIYNSTTSVVNKTISFVRLFLARLLKLNITVLTCNIIKSHHVVYLNLAQQRHIPRCWLLWKQSMS